MEKLKDQDFGVKQTSWPKRCIVPPDCSLHPSEMAIKWGLSPYLQGLLRGLSNNSQLLISVYYAPGMVLSALWAA